MVSDETLKQEIPAEPAPDYPRSRFKAFWRKLWRWEYTGLIIILLVTLGFHFAAIERPKTIIWDEKWYVGDARSIVTGGGDVRPEHPPLAKLFIVAGEYIFNGFKAPVENTGQSLKYPIGTAGDTIIIVDDASAFTPGTTIQINREQLNVTGINVDANQVIVGWHGNLQPQPGRGNIPLHG